MKTRKDNPRRKDAGSINIGLLAVITVVLVAGLVAMRVAGFQIAEDAVSLFIAKLPVLLLVALLVERTGEIFLTISRGGQSVNMEARLAALSALTEAKLARDTELGRLSKEIAACTRDTDKTPTESASEPAMRDPKGHKASLEKKVAELTTREKKEDAEIDSLEKEVLGNQKMGTIENRTNELTHYKNQTRCIAMSFNFLLALLVAACGFRAVEGLVILSPVGTAVNPATPAIDEAQLKELAQRLATQVRRDRESLEKVTDAGVREILKRQQDDAWDGWLEKGVMGASSTTASAVVSRHGEPVPPPVSAALRREIYGFRFLDILLTAGLLAGGADPISRIMKLLRDFIDKGSIQVNTRTPKTAADQRP